MAEIRIRGLAAAPRQTVWSVLADQTGMQRWAPTRNVAQEREGDPPPNGVGAVRVLSRSLLKIREQITDVDEPVRLAYRLLSGLPVRDYTGETILSERDGATDITMTPRFPGATFVVRRVIHSLVSGLVAESQRIEGGEGRT